jgi:hypothetical protein
MSGWPKKMIIVASTASAALTGVAAAAGRFAPYLAISVGGALVLLGLIASITWLLSLRMLLRHGREGGRLLTIENHVGWDHQVPHAGQGQLFDLDKESRRRRMRG